MDIPPPAAIATPPSEVASSPRSINDAAIRDMVAVAVGEVLRAHATGVESAASAGDEAAVGALDEGAAADRLDDAVVAAHDQRIAMLRERIGVACSTPGATAALADLTTRLHRAEAARQLAVARIAASDLALDPAAPAVSGACDAGGDRPTYTSITKPVRRDANLHVAAARSKTATSPISQPQRTVVASIRQQSATGPHFYRTSAEQYRRGHMMTVAYTGRIHSYSHHAHGRVRLARLARARRALARARAALAGPAMAPQKVHAMGLPAGWWRWQGSGAWALRTVNGGV